MQTWIILALISVGLLTLTRILQKSLFLEEADPIVNNFYFQIIIAITLLIFAAITGFNLSGYENFIPNIILMTILYGIGGNALFIAFKHLEGSIVTIIMATSSIWTIIWSLIFLNERLTAIQIIGIALIIGAVVLVSIRKGNSKKISTKGLIYAFLASFMFGSAFANDAFTIGDKNIPSYSFLSFLLPAILLFCIFPRKIIQETPKLLNKSFLIKMLALGIVYAAFNILTFSAYQLGGNASIISPIQQASIVLVVIFSALFLNEKDNIAKKLIASSIALIGIVLTLI